MGARLSWTSEGKEISIKSASEVGFTANGGNLNLKSCVCGQVNSCQTTSTHGWRDGTIKSVTLTPTHSAVKWWSPAARLVWVKVALRINKQRAENREGPRAAPHPHRSTDESTNTLMLHKSASRSLPTAGHHRHICARPRHLRCGQRG